MPVDATSNANETLADVLGMLPKLKFPLVRRPRCDTCKMLVDLGLF